MKRFAIRACTPNAVGLLPSLVKLRMKTLPIANHGAIHSRDTLYEANIDEKHKTNLPTEKGIQLGITVRIQQNPEGKEYQRVFYDISAQRVMLTNIESIAVIR